MGFSSGSANPLSVESKRDAPAPAGSPFGIQDDTASPARGVVGAKQDGGGGAPRTAPQWIRWLSLALLVVILGMTAGCIAISCLMFRDNRRYSAVDPHEGDHLSFLWVFVGFGPVIIECGLCAIASIVCICLVVFAPKKILIVRKNAFKPVCLAVCWSILLALSVWAIVAMSLGQVTAFWSTLTYKPEIAVAVVRTVAIAAYVVVVIVVSCM